MWKWFIGPALLGTTAIGGSVYGRDAEDVAHKSTSDTYAAVEQALDDVPQSGTTSFDGGTPVQYEVKIDRSPDRQLVATILFAGEEGARAQFDFTPQDGGKATLIAARIHGDERVLSQVLAGTSRARLAYAPDWLLNLAARPVLAEMTQEIDRGEMARFTGPTTEGEAEAQWEQNLSEDQRNNVEAWREYDATRPTTDPDAAAVNTTASN
jgi:hypothetical protein